MWTLISLAQAACEAPIVEDLIPLGGELRKTSWVRIRTGLSSPDAELVLVEDPERIYQMSERLPATDHPVGWLGFQIPEEIYDDDYDLVVYDGADIVGTELFTVFQFAEVGELASDLVWTNTDISPTNFNPDLCAEEGEPAWHIVTVTLESPEAPGNGWLIEGVEREQIETWVGMPEFGGEVVLTWYVHWMKEQSCPVVRVLDPFHEVQATYGGDCLVLPELLGDADDDAPRFDVACGCHSAAGGALSAAGLAVLLVCRRRRLVRSE
ncbi:MAG TPA: hypothetical protein QGF58_17750 [Myxococcota bacterium]|nr:hypothetical protein [Myxococcota bacterium]